MGKTIAEKIFSLKTGKDLKAGDVAVVEVDFAFSQDGTSSLVIDSFYQMEMTPLLAREKYALVIDHSYPAPNMSISNIHEKMRQFAFKFGFLLYEGEGISHQILLEKGHILPGMIITGADSHTCSAGAVNAFACGMGSTDIALIIATGRNWFRIPESVRINLYGRLPHGVFAKDIILALMKRLKDKPCNYKAIEFGGESIKNFNLDERLTLTNMVVEVNAKAGLMEFDEKLKHELKIFGKRIVNSISPDHDAEYSWVEDFDLSKLEPQIALPHEVTNIVKVEEVLGTKIKQGFIGTCTNGRLSDLRIAAQILNGKKISPAVRLIVVPASKQVFLSALEEGIIDTLVKAGATVLAAGCGPCVGTHAGIPADGEVVISTANRNFRGRMGNPNAFIYLASPATVAASCLKGEIADPRRYLN